MMERLQKILAAAGLGSRRHCESLITEGRVTVNGKLVTTLGAKADPEKDRICIDGNRIRIQRKVYYVLNKPKGYITTQSDEFGRKRAVDLLQGVTESVFPVGRLDKESTGLLLFTNDGELAHQLTHPSFGVRKTYNVVVRGRVDPSVASQMTRGIHLSEGRASAFFATIKHVGRDSSIIEITMREGRNREIRRMLARLGFKVKALKRVRFGCLTDRGLAIGQFRPLSSREVEALRKCVNREKRQDSQRPGQRGSTKPSSDA